jgi:hypothetical protein
VKAASLDIAKSVFQVHGVGATGAVVVQRRLSRGKMLRFFARIRHASSAYFKGRVNGNWLGDALFN